MRCLVLIAVVITGTVARPETYREKEDFQYSRSSSDEGSKSGYYGAQRGNMGGNYERAHNMDTLAQHQMSGLVHQVEGEVGDTSNTNAGNVFTAANSRGIYGSGRYDLSNLEGRNFQEGTSYGQEGTSYGNSHSQSALTNSAYRNHASGSNSYIKSNSYSDRSEHEQREEIQSSNLRSGESVYQQEHGAHGGSSSQGYSWSPYQNRLVSTRPMRILVRPGTRVTVPIATQTYDAAHSASSYDASVYNHNAAKSDAEVIINNDHETSNRQVPTSKHYESSYSYRKEWEKHHSSPGAVPLGVDIDSSIPKTSELYDDSQHTQTYNNQHQYASNAADSHSHQSSNLYGYNRRSNLDSSSQSRQQAGVNVQQERLSSDLNALSLNTQQSNLNQDYANQQGLVNSKPKSYQSSYSYHKSWERQGDPYVIVPVPDVQNGQASQRLSTSSSSHSGSSSHQYGSNRKQSYTSSNGLMDCDCDEEGHIRVARSYNTDQEVQQQQNGWEDFGQQSQQLWDGQQTQSQWDKIEDLGQQTQTQFDKIEEFGQQSQNRRDKTEDLGQHAQNPWDQSQNLEQHSENQWDKTEDLGQHAQNSWDQSQNLEQHSQNQWDKTEDLGQHAQNPWDQSQNLEQHSQNQWDKTEDLGQHTQDQWDQSQNLGQQSHNQWEKIEDLGQHTQDQLDQSRNEDLGQHSQNQWDKNSQFDQQSQSNVGQEQTTWNKLEKSNEDKHSHQIFKDQSYSNTFSDDVTQYTDKQTERGHKEQTIEQQNYFYTHLPNDFHTHHSDESLSDSRSQHTSLINSFWDKLDRLSGESMFNSNHNTNEFTTLIDNGYQSNLSKESTTTENVVGTEKSVVNPKDLGRGDIPDTTVVHPKNIGRGDVPDTPEGLEVLKHPSTTENINVVSTTASSLKIQNKAENRTPQEIETFSLTAKHHEITEKPKKFDENSDDTIRGNDIQVNEQSEHSSNSHNVNHHFQGEQVLEEKDQQITNHLYENYDQQNMNHHYGDFDQQSENFDQQNMKHDTQNFKKPVEIVDLHKSDQNLVYNFSKWNENLDKQSMNHHNESFDQQNVNQETQHFEKPVEIVDQQNVDHNFVDFSNWNLDQHSMNHHSEGFDQQNQQNMEQELQSFDKPGVSFDQQNLNQNLVDFSQFGENAYDQNTRQQPESLHRHSENLNQQKFEQELQHFGKPSDSFGQENLNQNLVDFGQFSENAHQQSTHQESEIFHEHSENINLQKMEQELQSFDKLTDSFDQQNLNENFDQKNMNENYGFNPQSENLHQSNMEQELQNFDKLSDSYDQKNLNPNLEDSSKLKENLEQQSMSHNLEGFDQKNENLEQQNMGQELQNFDNIADIYDQQNLNQNLDNFSQFNEKYSQQNTNQGSQDFSKPAESFDQQQNQNFNNIEKLNQNFNEHNLQHQSNNQQFDLGTGRENYDQQTMDESFKHPVPESKIVPKHVAGSNSQHLILSTQQIEPHKVSQTTLPPEPEQTGFWASVGKKFTNAKDKVSSWFRKKTD